MNNSSKLTNDLKSSWQGCLPIQKIKDIKNVNILKSKNALLEKIILF